NGLVQGAAALGMAAAFPVFGPLCDVLGWPAAFAVTGGVTAAVALVGVVYATDFPSRHPSISGAELRLIEGDRGAAGWPGEQTPRRDDPGAWRTLIGNRSLILLTLSYAAIGYIEYLFFFWMHYYFDDVLKLGKDESRVYATVLFLAMAAGMALGG